MKVCTSNNFPGDAAALGPHLEDHWDASSEGDWFSLFPPGAPHTHLHHISALPPFPVLASLLVCTPLQGCTAAASSLCSQCLGSPGGSISICQRLNIWRKSDFIIGGVNKYAPGHILVVSFPESLSPVKMM